MSCSLLAQDAMQRECDGPGRHTKLAPEHCTCIFIPAGHLDNDYQHALAVFSDGEP